VVIFANSCAKSARAWILPALVLAAALQGCIPCYYAPGAQNVPLFKEKYQANLSGAYKIGMYTQGCDFQAAASVTNHMAFLLNYSYFFGKDATPMQDDDYSDRFHSNTIDIGMGYFLPIDDKFVFETYAGYGSASIRNDYEESFGSGNSTLHASSFFLQPEFGFYKKNVELAVSLRYRLVNYDKVAFRGDIGSDPYSLLIDLDDHPFNYFLEPAFTVRMGGEVVKAQIQVGFSALLNQESLVDYDPFLANFGLIITMKEKD